ncbi:MAG TPA: hypothetical protein VG276_14440 [Actinomycetes bacterium]|jgi:hypothetical protein|nr:hypothetical protein [Actinomycetes bacterium]
MLMVSLIADTTVFRTALPGQEPLRTAGNDHEAGEFRQVLQQPRDALTRLCRIIGVMEPPVPPAATPGWRSTQKPTPRRARP